MLVNLHNCIVAICTAVLCAGGTIYNLIQADAISASVFALLCLLFAWVAVREGSTVHIDNNGVRLIRLGHTTQFLPWNEVAEIGVVGLKVFHAPLKKKKYGTKYIYFSREKLTDDERFQMCLQWPPKQKIFLRYSFDRVSRVQAFWSNTIHVYNADDIEI